LKVCLFLNHACNLRCTYCYNGDKFDRRMPWEVAARGVEMAFEGPTDRRAMITFFGGEPLMEMPLIERVVDHAEAEASRRDRRLRFVVVTNGTLLKGVALDFLLHHDAYVGVSLDGCREAHDATRRYRDGRSSYDRVVGNLRTFLERGGGSGSRLIAVVDPANVDRMPASFDAMLELGARNLVMNINYEADWDEAARDRFAVALLRLGDRYMRAHRAGAVFTFKLFDDKIGTHLKGGYLCSDRCDFGCEEVAVAPSGRLYPCDRLVGQDDRPELAIGDVFDGIDAVRRDALLEEKNRVAAGCAECALLPRCKHWCGCVNHAMTGSVGGVSGLLCWFEQQVTEQADRCASLLYEEKCEGFQRRFYGSRSSWGNPE